MADSDEVLAALTGTLGLDRDAAMRWLHTPNKALAGAVPCTAAKTPEGRERVLALIEALAEGITL